jgi:hypothetical protein
MVVGPENVFVSIIESYSKDSTSILLQDDLVPRLRQAGIPHRITTNFATEQARCSSAGIPVPKSGVNRKVPYSTAPERMTFLSEVRNAALDPISSSDSDIRLPDYETYTKVIFLNDIYFTAADIVRLIATRLDGDTSKASDADLICASDFDASGKSWSCLAESCRG